MLDSLGNYAIFKALWNLGVKNFSVEMESAISSNNHMKLLSDEEVAKKYMNYLNVVRFSSKYKQDNPSYSTYHPTISGTTQIFKENKKFANRVKQLLKTEMSPGLIDTENLMVAPHTYFIVCEMDGLKDEQLLYAERLKSLNRPIEIAYYKKGFHGMAPLISSKWGFELSRKMLSDLGKYISKNV